MGEQSCSIGIDIGTTSVKVIAFVDGSERARASRRLEMLPAKEDGAKEQDVVLIYQAVMDALGEVLHTVQRFGGEVRCIGFSAAMHSLLAVDSTGRPLTGAMTWLDTRADGAAATIWTSKSGLGLYQRTGTPIHPMAPLPKLVWLRQARPEVFAKAEKFVSIKEWIWFQWFGEWVIDQSLASATGLFDIRKQDWDEEALGWAGLSPERLSRPVPTSYCRQPQPGSPLVELGLGTDVSVNVGASDGVLANLGAGVIDNRAMVLTLGTSCAVRVGSPRPLTDPVTRPFSYILSADRYVVGAPSNSGGVVLEHVHRRLCTMSGEPSMSLSDALAQAGQVETGSLLYLPYVAGERAPLWNASATGAVLGLTTEHRGKHILRAAVEGILLNAYWMAARLMEEVGRPERLIACGKLFDLSWTRKLAADVFGLPVETADAADASTLGAVRLAEISNGMRDWTDVSTPASSVVNLPDDAQHARWNGQLQRFQEAARALGLLPQESGRQSLDGTCK
ncbi:MAG: gluconokinase [Alicyclobacillus herbarius]|uniref:gluconokinase n=1 Tax=Alicyclobacillus herbarius TaxID=122960 RepID=UPI002353C5A0|nr:gluconokinase [Alicyclobacillus herbarius]MCL6632557.1 gluconokinase [Alicyclobacillus herbarius]